MDLQCLWVGLTPSQNEDRWFMIWRCFSNISGTWLFAEEFECVSVYQTYGYTTDKTQVINEGSWTMIMSYYRRIGWDKVQNSWLQWSSGIYPLNYGCVQRVGEEDFLKIIYSLDCRSSFSQLMIIFRYIQVYKSLFLVGYPLVLACQPVPKLCMRRHFGRCEDRWIGQTVNAQTRVARVRFTSLFPVI